MLLHAMTDKVKPKTAKGITNTIREKRACKLHKVSKILC